MHPRMSFLQIIRLNEMELPGLQAKDQIEMKVSVLDTNVPIILVSRLCHCLTHPSIMAHETF